MPASSALSMRALVQGEVQRLKALVRLEEDTVLALQQALNGAGRPWAAPKRDQDSAALVVANTSTSQTWEVQLSAC